ncbi:MAG: LysM peptidoglycan-binding domain-containing protein [Lentisphaeria bacterium]|nr:LysM peptidoglycan-binding domain-containing protein [Lentisphaeria bacterium]
MKAKFRIVIPAAASVAVAVFLLTGCADKPVRIPGGAFVEEPYTGDTETKSHTVLNNGKETIDNEIIFIDDDVPVGPVDDSTQASQGSSTAQQGGGSTAQQGGATLQPVEQEQTANSNVPEGSVEYKVVKGDTLWGISMVYGVPMARLIEINGLDPKAPLRIGQVIMIPPDAGNAVGKPVQKKTETKPASTSTTKSNATSTTKSNSTKAQPVTKEGETLYVVKSGDNLSMIAYRHHVKLADLVAANKVDPKDILRVGQTLVIPAPTAKSASTSTSTTKSATATSTTTKTDSASTAKPATTTTTTTTKTDSASTATSASSSAQGSKGGEGTGGIVGPIDGTSLGGGSASSSTPASTSSSSAASATAGLAPVSELSDADVFAVPINSEATLEEVARNHDKNLDDLIRLNPEFKPGQKIPAGTAVKMPLF